MSRFTNEQASGAFDPTKNNVEAIARLEEEALELRSRGERISDAVTHVVGTFGSVALHLLWFTLWVTVNLSLVPGVPAFDPFPFGILTLLVSGEGVLLALFILVSQNRMTRQADRRAHLALQVSMLAEQELTLLLQMQQRLGEHLGVAPPVDTDETRQLMERTDVQHLVRELEERMPDEWPRVTPAGANYLPWSPGRPGVDDSGRAPAARCGSTVPVKKRSLRLRGSPAASRCSSDMRGSLRGVLGGGQFGHGVLTCTPMTAP